MELKTMKTLALTSAVALSLALSGSANAQVETMTAQLITASAITSATVSDMDFGEWFIQFVAGTPTLTLTDIGTPVVSQTGTIGTSQAVLINASTSEGVLTVQTPAASALTMVASSFTDIADIGLSLQEVTYRTATENGLVITAGAVTLAVPVTVLGNAIDETITFGGDIDITVTPADATHTATFDITFAY